MNVFIVLNFLCRWGVPGRETHRSKPEDAGTGAFHSTNGHHRLLCQQAEMLVCGFVCFFCMLTAATSEPGPEIVIVLYLGVN